MAVHNNLDFLPAAVDSILEQTHQDFELIIIDDGSTDGSQNWLINKAKQDARIQLIIQENKGLTRSLNHGLSLTSGEFIARMDGDDVSLPNRLETQLAFLLENPECICVGSFTEYINDKGQKLFTRFFPIKHDEIMHCHIAGYGGFIQHPSAFIRASALREVDGYDEQFDYAQDYDLWFRLSRIGKLANIPIVLLQYRFHEKAITQNALHKQKKYLDQIRERERKVLGDAIPAKFDERYIIYPQDARWLLERAIQECNLRLAAKLEYRFIVRILKDQVRLLKLLIVSFKKKDKVQIDRLDN